MGALKHSDLLTWTHTPLLWYRGIGPGIEPRTPHPPNLALVVIRQIKLVSVFLDNPQLALHFVLRFVY